MTRGALGLLMVLAGCVRPDALRTGPSPVPTTFTWVGRDSTAAVHNDAWDERTWWSQFGVPAVDSLVALGMMANTDLAVATARLSDAQASARIAGAKLLPTVTGRAEASRAQTVIGNFGALRLDVLSQATSASWELDIFGQLRQERASAVAGLRASGYDVADLERTIQGRIVRRAVDAMGVTVRLALADSSVNALRTSAALLASRARAGVASEFDAVRAHTLADDAAATVPSLRAEWSSAIGELAVLCGTDVARVDALLSGVALPARTLSAPVADAPADVLRRRPDVRAAELRVVAAAARVTAAKAALRPSLSLGGTLGVNRTGSRPSASTWSFGPSLSRTLFNRGAKGELDARRASVMQREAEWRGSVLGAARDVETAYAQWRADAVRTQLLRTVVGERLTIESLASARWRGGQTDYRDVLDAARQRLDAEQGLVRQRVAELQAVATIHQALGGGASRGDGVR
ncbi:MAG: efflux transporter outer membrane subunit [Gemmatimonadaceae bacterium]|nr:efflux transporter outer membrane subunit [Gemmatimonadaceae bacterium]